MTEAGMRCSRQAQQDASVETVSLRRCRSEPECEDTPVPRWDGGLKRGTEPSSAVRDSLLEGMLKGSPGDEGAPSASQGERAVPVR